MNDGAQQDAVDSLASEFIDRCRDGDAPTIEDYVTQYPELADTIRDLFPMIAALEGMKLEEQKSAARFATLQPLRLTELGDFRIVREIGRGGMGIVYEAEQRSLGRHVALKVLPKQALLDPAQLKRFQREARLAARLHHTNLVSLFGVGEHEGFHFLVMELVDGFSLDKLIAYLRSIYRSDGESKDLPETTDTEKLTRLVQLMLGPGAPIEREPCAKPARTRAYWDHVARIGRDAADALQHAAERGILHRDIKPGNLILDVSGSIRISDFGLAQPLTAQHGTVTQSLGGTLCYLAPETFSGKVDARSDVYSLGLTLYELLTLEPAFRDQNPAEAMKRVANGSFQTNKPRTLDPSIPKDLETVVLKAMANQPQRRYTTAADLSADLQRFLDDQPVLARRTSSIEHFRRWCLRNKAVASLSLLAATLLVAVSLVSFRGYIHARQSNREVTSALAREMKQRERSEATLQVAAAALDDIYKEFSPGTSHGLNDLASAEVETKGAGQGSNATPVLSAETAVVLENLLTFYDRLAEQGGSNRQLQDASAQAMARIGDIYRQLGQRSRALAHYNKALETYQQMVVEPADEILVGTERARIHNDIGRVLFADGNYDAAAESHQQALQVIEGFEKASRGSAGHYEKARALYLLGRKKPDSASRVALDQLSELDRRPGRRRRPPPNPESRERDGRRHKNLRGAIDTIHRLSVGQRDSPSYQFLLACCYREVPQKRGRDWLSFEKSHGQRSLDLLEDLVKRFPDDQQYRYELVETLRSDVDQMRGSSGFNQRIRDLENALLHADYLVERHPNVPIYALARMHVLHRTGHQLAEWAKRAKPNEAKGSLERAVKAHQDAERQVRRLTKRWPGVAAYQLWAIVVEGSLAQVYLEAGDQDRAKQAIDSANAALVQVVESQDDRSELETSLPDIRKALAFLRNKIED